MKQDNGAGVEFFGAVGVAATSLVDIDALGERMPVGVGTVPAFINAGGVVEAATKAVVDIEAVAVGEW